MKLSGAEMQGIRYVVLVSLLYVVPTPMTDAATVHASASAARVGAPDNSHRFEAKAAWRARIDCKWCEQGWYGEVIEGEREVVFYFEGECEGGWDECVDCDSLGNTEARQRCKNGEHVSIGFFPYPDFEEYGFFETPCVEKGLPACEPSLAADIAVASNLIQERLLDSLARHISQSASLLYNPARNAVQAVDCFGDVVFHVKLPDDFGGMTGQHAGAILGGV